MKKLQLLILTVGIISTRIFGQTPIDVLETTFKIGGFGGEEIFFYGFAEGDQLIFNFKEINGNQLKEIEITEYPTSSKFKDYNTNKIDKILKISNTGIYKFRLYNSSISKRICQVKIQRIPTSNSTKNFNTSVYNKTVYDTTYTSVQEKQLIRTDTVIANLTDQIAKVHSHSNLNGNKTTFNFTLPANTIAWSYYIGVDQEGQQAYQNAVNILSTKVGALVTKISEYGPLAALALGGVSYLSALQAGEDIDYYIVDSANVNLFSEAKPFFYLKKGKVINDFSRMLAPLNGSYHFCLANDNAITAVTVSVKITAIIVTEFWEDGPPRKFTVKPRQVSYLKN